MKTIGTRPAYMPISERLALGLVSEAIPGWVPEEAIGFSDFENGLYWTDDSGELTLADMWEQNQDWANFQSANVVAGTGMVSTLNRGNPVMVEAVAAPFLESGARIVADFTLGATGQIMVEFLELPGFSLEMYADFRASVDSKLYVPQAVATFAALGAGIHTAEVIISDVLGSLIVDTQIAQSGTPTDVLANCNHFAMAVKNADTVLRSLTFYPPTL